jgi:hypothetical protein
VLDAVALEDLDAAGVHADGDVDLQLAVRHAHHGVEVGVEVEQLRGAVEALHHRLEGILLPDAPRVVHHCLRHYLLQEREP